jgi:uncharacterized coiled-coil protein SlyX
MSEWGAGEAGGVFAGAVAALAVLGKGLAWLLNWNETRSSGREVRLAAWEHSLAERERAYREEIEGALAATRAELARVEHDLDTLRGVLGAMAAELHRHAPESPALARAARALGNGN